MVLQKSINRTSSLLGSYAPSNKIYFKSEDRPLMLEFDQQISITYYRPSQVRNKFAELTNKHCSESTRLNVAGMRLELTR